MKKTLSIIVVLLLGFALIGPKFAGMTFNQKVDDYIDAVNAQGVYEITMLEREQTWFSSTAEIKAKINLPNAAQQGDIQDWSANFQIEAQHGPFLTRSGFGIGWLDWAVTLIVNELPPSFKIASQDPIYQASGKMGLFADTSYQDRILAFTYTEPTMGMVFSTDGWQGQGHFSSSSFMYEGLLSNMKMGLPDTYDLMIDELQVSSDTQASIMDMLSGSFYNGNAALSMSELKLNNLVDKSSAQVSNLTLNSSIDFDSGSGLADTTTNLTLDSFTNAELTLKDTVLVLEVNNLQEAFFKAYQQMNKEIMESPDRAQSIMQETMQNHLLGQLSADPEFNLSKFEAVLNDGNINMSSNSKLVGISALPDTLESNTFWLEHLASTAQMNVDESAALFIAKTFIEGQLAGNPQLAEMEPEQFKQVIAQQSVATINSMVQQGLLEKTENGYSMSFTLNDGKATLNGKAMPIPM